MLELGAVTAEPAALPNRWQGVRESFGSAARTLNRNWLTRIGILLLLLFVAAALIGPAVTVDAREQTDAILQPPSWDHVFGTDHLGRDLLARSLEGARVSLLVAVASVVLGLLVALPLGLIAGFFGGTWLDESLMGLVDVILALPLFVLALFVLGITGTGSLHIAGVEIPGVWKVIFLIAVAATPLFARVARASALVERQEDYVDALRVSGLPRRTIVAREILVNVIPPVAVQAFLWMAIAIFAEAALSFLGLGVQPPDPTLGNLLYDANNYLLLGAWWYSLFPGVILVIAIVGFNLLGDGMSEVLDPQVRL